MVIDANIKREEPATRSHASAPVKWWAAVGVAFLVFDITVLALWVTGPLFETVPPGPTDVPTFMKVAIMFLQITCIPGALICLYFFAIRPWRRDGKLSVDGALTIALFTMWVQDPLSSYFGIWFTYNSWAANFGNWANSIPLATGKASPGAMVAEPILIIQGVYVLAGLAVIFLGSWVMRRARTRWPHLNNAGLVVICFATMVVFDLIFEAVLFMPLGIWALPGGRLSLTSPGTYYQYPLVELIAAPAIFSALAMLRFFTNERGETLADRGVVSLDVSDRRKSILRALAMIGAVNVAMLLCYNVPGAWNASRSAEWPADLQKRSYFVDGICGQGTDQMCPGPAVPQFRNDNSNPNGGSAHLDPGGHLVVPPDAVLPTVVPVQIGK